MLDTMSNKKDLKNKKHKPKIVVIGGGTGLPVILKNLKKFDVDMTAVVTVADNGGSSGVLRNYINVLPPGDIRNVMAALSTLPKLDLDIFQYRFESSDKFLAGHSIGNLIIAALSEMTGGFFDAIQKLSKIMKIDGHVYPASDSSVELHAEFSDGSTITGEREISQSNKLIKKVWVESTNKNGQKPKAVKDVVDAIMNADQIVLGPGSLFTSILPNLMIENVGNAVLKSKAKVVYICNIMTQKGETSHFTDADHVKVLNDHLHHNFIDTVLVNNKSIPESYIDYQKWDEIVQPVKHEIKEPKGQKYTVISSNFLELRNHGAFHDGELVVKELLKLLSESKASKKDS